MNQRTCLVLIHDGAEKAADRIRANYPNAFPMEHPGAFLIKTGQLSDEIAGTLKIKGDDRDLMGVVFGLKPAYAGFSSRRLGD